MLASNNGRKLWQWRRMMPQQNLLLQVHRRQNRCANQLRRRIRCHQAARKAAKQRDVEPTSCYMSEKQSKWMALRIAGYATLTCGSAGDAGQRASSRSCGRRRCVRNARVALRRVSPRWSLPRTEIPLGPRIRLPMSLQHAWQQQVGVALNLRAYGLAGGSAQRAGDVSRIPATPHPLKRVPPSIH